MAIPATSMMRAVELREAAATASGASVLFASEACAAEERAEDGEADRLRRLSEEADARADELWFAWAVAMRESGFKMIRDGWLAGASHRAAEPHGGRPSGNGLGAPLRARPATGGRFGA